MDFRNLNKTCPKDEFPLLSVDVLIDFAVGHEMFSFMDGFSGVSLKVLIPINWLINPRIFM